MNTLIIYTDGGSRGNPGPAAYGAVIKSSDKKVLAELSEYIGISTNNVAEYSAVVAALTKAKDLAAEPTSLDVYMDSEVVKKQLCGEYRVVNKNLFFLYSQIKLLEKTYHSVKYTHIRREFNKEADAQVNKALDAALF